MLLVDGIRLASVKRAKALVRGGWDVDIATSAEDALAAVDDFLPEAIITEAHLNGALDGFALARRVKQDAATQRVPVIVLTDPPEAAVDQPAATPRYGTHVAKPCTMRAVVAALEAELVLADLLKLRRAQRAAREMPPPRTGSISPHPLGR